MAPLLRPSDLKKKIIRLAAAPERSTAELARALRMLHAIGVDGWSSFLQEAGIKQRRAYYLIGIDEQLHGLGIRQATVDEIGWTKMQIIARYLTRENKAEMLSLAKRSSAAQLQALVRKWKAGKTKKAALDTEPLHCVQLYLTPSQYAAFKAAILSNGGEERRTGRLSKKEAALMSLIAAAQAG